MAAAISSQNWRDAYRGMTRTAVVCGSVRDGAVLLPGGRHRLYRSLFYDDAYCWARTVILLRVGVIAHEVGHHVQKSLVLSRKYAKLLLKRIACRRVRPPGAHGATGDCFCRRVGTQYAAARRTGGGRSGRGAHAALRYRRRSLTATGGIGNVCRIVLPTAPQNSATAGLSVI